jgi:hypothetical protein
VKESVDQVEGLLEKPQAIEQHGFDRCTSGEVAPFRIVLGRLLDAPASAERVELTSDKAEVVFDLTPVRRLIRHHHFL